MAKYPLFFKPKFSIQQLKSVFIRFLPLIILGLVLTAVLFGLKKQSQSWYFQDETEHLTNGWMIWKFDRKLYTDLWVNHQPIPFLVGGILTKFLPYNTLFVLVERVRVAMFVLMSLWLILATWRFRWSGLMAAALVAVTSFWFFGWHVLGEALAAPAITISLGLLIERIFSKKPANNLDVALFSLISAFLAFSLSPLWPYILISSLIYICLLNLNQRLMMTTICLLCVALVFVFVSPIDWYQHTVADIATYIDHVHGAKSQAQTITSWTYPFQGIFHPNNALSIFFNWQLLLLAGAITAGLWSKKIKLVEWLKWLGLLILVLSLNNRTYDFPSMFYTGFHLYPFTAAWGMLIASFLVWIYQKTKSHIFSIFSFVVAAILISHVGQWTLTPQDKMNQHFINYGDFQATADLLKVIKSPNDTLLTGPDGAGYINLMSQIPIAGNELFHMPWAWTFAHVRDSFYHLLCTNLPTYVLFEPDSENGFHEALKPYLDKNYTRLKRSDGRETKIMVLNSKLETVSEEQKKGMLDLFFMTPEQLIERKNDAKI